MDYTTKIKRLAGRFVVADPVEALSIKRTLSGLASHAKTTNNLQAYKAYSRAARRLKTPRRRR